MIRARRQTFQIASSWSRSAKMILVVDPQTTTSCAMKLTDENKAFYHAVYSAVSEIPYGHATSYGHIAMLVDRPQNARQVGSALKHLRVIIPALLLELAAGEAGYALDTIPWWRVVSSTGKILPRENTGGEIAQAKHLYDEGLLPDCNLTIVDLRRFGWFPNEGDVDV